MTVLSFYKYEDTIPIEPYVSTGWIVQFEDGEQLLMLWHKKAKIEDIVDSVKTINPNRNFTVATVDVGEFIIKQTNHALIDGRMVNQYMEVVIQKYDE